MVAHGVVLSESRQCPRFSSALLFRRTEPGWAEQIGRQPPAPQFEIIIHSLHEGKPTYNQRIAASMQELLALFYGFQQRLWQIDDIGQKRHHRTERGSDELGKRT